MLGSDRPKETTPHVFPWYALKVRTGSEIRAAAALMNRGYRPYVPLYQERRLYSDRIKKLDKPAFPGYIFCAFDARKNSVVLSSPAVAYAVGYPQGPVEISDSEMEGIRRTLEAGGRPTDYLREGERVVIESGALTGLEGILVSVDGENLLTVSVHLLQRSLSLRIDAKCVRRL